MVMIDQPPLSADVSPVVLVAKNTVGQQGSISTPHAMGICQLVMLDEQGDGDKSLSNAVGDAETYFKEHYAKKIDTNSVTVRVIQKPQHGTVGLWALDDVYNPDDLSLKEFIGKNWGGELHTGPRLHRNRLPDTESGRR